MKTKIKVATALIFFIAIFSSFFYAFGSKTLSADKLYAVKLAQSPSEMDWNNAVPLIATAQNGNLHVAGSFVDIDKDTVHATSNSCHHLPPSAPPIEINLKAYYTDDELFMRISWFDATKDDKMFEFSYQNDKWNPSDKLEDGLGLMWSANEKDVFFNCSRMCHAVKWHLKDYSIVSQYQMNAIDDNIVDVWSWKATRTNALGFSDDLYIDKNGIAPDTFSRTYFYNSTLKENIPLDNLASKITPMEVGDTPIYDKNGLLIKNGYWMITGTAPGVIISMPSGNRADIRAMGEYKDRKWEVTLRRKLFTEDKKDVTFNVKRNNAYKFGVSVMDNTLTNHYAVKETLELFFVDDLESSLQN